MVGTLVVLGVLTAVLVPTWGGAVWASAAAIGLGTAAGLLVAFGGLDRGPFHHRRGPRRADPAATAVSWLDRATTSQLDRLDPLEHRRLDVGAPWPVVVVGPTGVSVVAVDDGGPRPSTDRLAEVLEVVTEVARRRPVGRQVDVLGLLVVPPGAVTTTPPGVEAIVPAQLVPRIAHGALVPMSTVRELATRISAVLAPDLHLDAS